MNIFKNIFKRVSLSAVVLAFIISVSGCVPVLVGAGAAGAGYVYYNGSLKQTENYTLEELHKAILAALAENDLLIISDQVGENRILTRFQLKDNTKSKVVLNAITQKATQISIRIGRFGDKGTSVLLLEEIEAKLPKVSSTAK